LSKYLHFLSAYLLVLAVLVDVDVVLKNILSRVPFLLRCCAYGMLFSGLAFRVERLRIHLALQAWALALEVILRSLVEHFFVFVHRHGNLVGKFYLFILLFFALVSLGGRLLAKDFAIFLGPGVPLRLFKATHGILKAWDHWHQLVYW